MSDGVAHFEFQTTAFIDGDEERKTRVNEHIGSMSLARWLSAQLRQRGIDASEPWNEDHGCDFSIAQHGKAYLCICYSDDEGDMQQNIPRSAAVALDQVRSLGDRLFGRNRASREDALSGVIQDLLRSHPAISHLNRAA